VDESQKQFAWKILNAVAAGVSVVVTQRLLGAVWRWFGGGPPPKGPADRKVTFGAALTWAVSMGVGVGVARLIAVRVSARVWEAATNEAPPDT
jgi:hypothetical protein